MIGIVHRDLTEELLKKLEMPVSYVEWAVAPDIDMYEWHRYKYHKLSSFDDLYLRYIDEYDMSNCLDKKTARFVCLYHIWLDMLSGAVKVFDGLNTTIHSRLIEVAENMGHIEQINRIYHVITHPTKEYTDALHQIFKEIPMSSLDTGIYVMYTRMREETIGVYSTRGLDKDYAGVLDIDATKTAEIYDGIVSAEAKIIDSMSLLDAL